MKNRDLVDHFFGREIKKLFGESSFWCSLFYFICREKDLNRADLCFHRRLQTFREYAPALAYSFNIEQMKQLAGHGFAATEKGAIRCMCCGCEILIKSLTSIVESVQNSHNEQCSMISFFQSCADNEKYQSFLKHLRRELTSTKVSVALEMDYSMANIIYAVGLHFQKFQQGHSKAGDLAASLEDIIESGKNWFIPELNKNVFQDLTENGNTPDQDSSPANPVERSSDVRINTATTDEHKHVIIAKEADYTEQDIERAIRRYGPFQTAGDLIDALATMDYETFDNVVNEIHSISYKLPQPQSDGDLTTNTDRLSPNQTAAVGCPLMPIQEESESDVNSSHHKLDVFTDTDILRTHPSTLGTRRRTLTVSSYFSPRCTFNSVHLTENVPPVQGGGRRRTRSCNF